MSIASAVESELLDQMITNTNQSLRELSEKSPVMLIFLRHFGCTFCREALSDISKKRQQIQSMGAQLVFVHMSSPEVAERYFNRYELEDTVHISDPDCQYYAAFGLTKGNFTQLFGLQTFIRGFQSSVLEGHGVGPAIGDGFQMPGIFILQDGEIKEQFIHRLASDRPNYEALARCCAID